MRLLVSPCPSVCPYTTIREQMNSLLWSIKYSRLTAWQKDKRHRKPPDWYATRIFHNLYRFIAIGHGAATYSTDRQISTNHKIFTINMEDMKTQVFCGCQEWSTGECLLTIRKIVISLYSAFNSPRNPGLFNPEDGSVTILRIVGVCSLFSRNNIVLALWQPQIPGEEPASV